MNNYSVLELVGEGSYGQVYRALNKNNFQVVALKFIKKRGRSRAKLQILEKEINIMRDLQHPNIVQFYDSFETHSQVVIVTEFVKEQLFHILEQNESLPERLVQNIACQLVSALYYLHSHRIIHRDVKPQNILLGDDGVVKLCDFGFAREMSDSTMVLTSLIGTPLYMSPELVEEKPYDHTADLWSLGCILYELHTGEPPFYSDNLLNLLNLTIKSDVTWPHTMNDSCTSFLKGLLIKDPLQRLSWPDLLHHPFVADDVVVVPDVTLSSPLTVSPSPDMLTKKQKQSAEMSVATAGRRKWLQSLQEKEDAKNGKKTPCAKEDADRVRSERANHSTAEPAQASKPAKASKTALSAPVPPTQSPKPATASVPPRQAPKQAPAPPTPPVPPTQSPKPATASVPPTQAPKPATAPVPPTQAPKPATASVPPAQAPKPATASVAPRQAPKQATASVAPTQAPKPATASVAPRQAPKQAPVTPTPPVPPTQAPKPATAPVAPRQAPKQAPVPPTPPVPPTQAPKPATAPVPPAQAPKPATASVPPAQAPKPATAPVPPAQAPKPTPGSPHGNKPKPSDQTIEGPSTRPKKREPIRTVIKREGLTVKRGLKPVCGRPGDTQLSDGSVTDELMLRPLTLLVNLVMTPDVNTWCVPTLQKTMTSLLMNWERNQDWTDHHNRWEELIQPFKRILCEPPLRALAPLSALLLRLFSQHVNLQVDVKNLVFLLEAVGSDPSQFLKTPPPHGLCDGLMFVLLQSIHETENNSSVPLSLNPLVFVDIWKKIHSELTSTAKEYEFCSADGLRWFLEAMFSLHHTDVKLCLPLYYDRESRCVDTLSQLLLPTGFLSPASDIVVSFSAELLLVPFVLLLVLDLPKPTAASILDLYHVCGVFPNLLQVFPSLPHSLLVWPLHLLKRMLLSDPERSYPLLREAATAGFLSAPSDTHPTASPHSDTHPTASSHGDTHPTASSHGDTHPTASSHGDTHPTASSHSDTHPTASSHGDTHPTASSHGDTHPTASSHGDTHPTASSHGDTHPTASSHGDTHPTASSHGDTHPIASSHGDTHPIASSHGDTHPTASSHSDTHPTASSHSDTHPTASSHGDTHPAASSHGDTHPTASSHGDTHPAASSHGDTHPAASSHGDTHPAASSHGDTHPAASSHGDTHPTASSHGDTRPTASSHGDTRPTASSHSDTPPTASSHGDTHPTASSHGDTRPTASSHGDTHPTASSHGDTPPTASSHGDTHPAASSHGDTHPTASSHGDTRPTASSHGDTHPTASSHGYPHRAASSHGDTRPTASSHGDTRPTASSHGYPHRAASSHGYPHRAASSHGDTHPTASSHGYPHRAASSHGDTHPTASSHGYPHRAASSHGYPHRAASSCHRSLCSRLPDLLGPRELWRAATELLNILAHAARASFFSAGHLLHVDSSVLRRALTHHDPMIRAATCRLLANVNPLECLPSHLPLNDFFKDLVECLRHFYMPVRRNACHAVGNWLAYIAVRQSFKKKKRREDLAKEERRWAEQALAALPALVSLMKDHDAVTRRHCCCTLRNAVLVCGDVSPLLDDDVQTMLRKTANKDSDDDVRRAANDTLTFTANRKSKKARK